MTQIDRRDPAPVPTPAPPLVSPACRPAPVCTTGPLLVSPARVPRKAGGAQAEERKATAQDAAGT